MAHPSRGNCREGRPVTARKRTLALSRSLSARARSRIAELDQEIERLQHTEEAIVVPQVRPASPNARHGSCWVSRSWRRVARYMGRCTVVEQHHHVTRRPTLPFRAMSDSPLTPLK